MTTTASVPASISAASTRILPVQHQLWRPPPQESALPLHVQSLERAVDINVFINQLDTLLSTPVEALAITTDHQTYGGTSQGRSFTKKSLLSTKNIWDDEQVRKRDLSCLYNFSTLGNRKWLKNVLLEESDSDSDAEQVITERDLKILLKIHKYRRKYQKRYHTDILNSQYTYFGAGLLSEYDRFPDHKKFILSEYGFTAPAPLPPHHTPAASTAGSPASPAKRLPVKRRRDSQRSTTSNAEGQNKQAQWSQSAASTGSDTYSLGNGHRSSDFNSPMSSPSGFPYFAVPLVKVPSSSFTSTVMEAKVTASVAATVPSLVRPVAAPDVSDVSIDAVRWRAWRAMAVDDIPKAHTERLIQRKYQSVVLKQIALYCAQFLEQSREAANSGKSKAGNRHGKKQHGSGWHAVGLRPINKQQQASRSK